MVLNDCADGVATEKNSRLSTVSAMQRDETAIGHIHKLQEHSGDRVVLAKNENFSNSENRNIMLQKNTCGLPEDLVKMSQSISNFNKEENCEIQDGNVTRKNTKVKISEKVSPRENSGSDMVDDNLIQRGNFPDTGNIDAATGNICGRNKGANKWNWIVEELKPNREMFLFKILVFCLFGGKFCNLQNETFV